MFMLWTFLFGRFDRQDKVSQTRVLLWEGVHFPLHFSILLLLAGMVNTIINISTYSGVEKAAGQVRPEGTLSGYQLMNNLLRPQMQFMITTLNNGTRLPADSQEQISNYFESLELIPGQVNRFHHTEPAKTRIALTSNMMNSMALPPPPTLRVSETLPN